MNITVLYNTPETEEPSDQDTKKSAIEVCDALNKIPDFKAELMGITKDEIEKLRDLKTDFVFNLLEWTGHNAKYCYNALNIFDWLHLPYSGSRKLGQELSDNKILMKQKFVDLKIPTPNYQIYDKEFVFNELQFPVIAKLAWEHCSLGLDETNIVNNAEDLRSKILDLRTKYNMPVLVEEYVEGDEVQVAVITQAKVLPPQRIVFSNGQKILSHGTKWENQEDHSAWGDFEQYPAGTKFAVTELAKKVYENLGGRSYARVDMRVNNNGVYVLEINNNPGIDWDDDNALCKSAKVGGFATFPDFLKTIVYDAITN